MTENNMLAGICIDDIGTGKTKEDVIMGIYTNFNKSMKRLLVVAQKYVGNNDHMKTITTLIKFGDEHVPTILIQKTYKNLLEPEASQAILNKNIDYFIEKDYNKYIKKDEYLGPLRFIVDFMKKKIKTLPEEEFEYVWDLIGIMLICCDEYVKYMNKYNMLK